CAPARSYASRVVQPDHAHSQSTPQPPTEITMYDHHDAPHAAIPPLLPLRRASGASAAAARLGLCMLATVAHAQRVTGTIQGRIVRSGEPQASAKGTATNLTNGAVVTADDDQ